MSGGRRPGAGRPRAAVPSISVTFDVPPDLHATVTTLATSRGLTFAAAAREALAAWCAAEAAQ